MRLWVISDWHLETRVAWQPVRPESFDVLVVAGDVDDDLERAIECVAMIADGKPCVYVAGNHEVAVAPNVPATTSAAGALAGKYGVTWLEGGAVDIDGVLFAGAMIWGEGYPLFVPSVRRLAVLRADVVVTHFPPTPAEVVEALPAGGVWVCGHHHGYEDTTIDGRRLIRNALGYANEHVGRPAVPDLIVEIEQGLQTSG